MASGVQVADEVCRIFYDMKVRKCSTPEEIKKRKKAVIFCLSPDKKCIIVEEGKEILVGDVGVTVTDPFKHFVQMLPEKDCRYALYDASFETKESKKEELMFFLWAPEQAPLKSKMIYASSKDAIKKKFQASSGALLRWGLNRALRKLAHLCSSALLLTVSAALLSVQSPGSDKRTAVTRWEWCLTKGTPIQETADNRRLQGAESFQEKRWKLLARHRSPPAPKGEAASPGSPGAPSRAADL